MSSKKSKAAVAKEETPVVPPKATNEKEPVAPVKELEKAVVEALTTASNAAQSNVKAEAKKEVVVPAVEEVKPQKTKVVKEEPKMAVKEEDVTLVAKPKTKVKDSLLIIDDQVVELKPLGPLAGLLGFVDKDGYKNTGIDLTGAKHAILNDVLVVLNNGSSVTINQAEVSDRNIRYAKAGDFSVGALPIIFLENSKIVSSWWIRTTGKNKLIDSSIAGTGDMFADVELDNASLISSSIKAGNIRLEHTTQISCHITANSVTVKSSYNTNLGANTVGAYRLTNFNTTKQMSVYGYTSVELAPNHEIYEQDLKLVNAYTSRDGRNNIDLKIISRVDYGHFNAVKPLPFVRCNVADMVVGGTYLNSEKFDKVLSRYSSELGQSSSGGSFNSGTFSPCDCVGDEEYLDIVRAIYYLAMSKDSAGYKPDRSNAIENGIIMNLLEQIRSRMNLYKQVNSVVN